MVRLVFRPYTQVGRPICTSGPLRASTRVSSGFACPGIVHHLRVPSHTPSSTCPAVRARRAGDGSGGWPTAADLEHPLRGPDPRPDGAGAVGDGLRTVRLSTHTPGARGPAPPRREERRREDTAHDPVSGKVGAWGLCKAHDPEAASHLRPTLPGQTGAGRGAPPRKKCARRRPSQRPGGGPHRRGSTRTDRADRTRRVESSGQTVRTPPVYLLTVSRLLNSLFKVLFNFPSRYLSTIGLVPVFSLRWSLPPTLGCIPKQPDSKKNRTPAGRGPLPASHRPRAKPPSEGLGPPARAERAVFCTPHFPRPVAGAGIRRWALPSSLAATEGILVALEGSWRPPAIPRGTGGWPESSRSPPSATHAAGNPTDAAPHKRRRPPAGARVGGRDPVLAEPSGRVAAALPAPQRGRERRREPSHQNDVRPRTRVGGPRRAGSGGGSDPPAVMREDLRSSSRRRGAALPPPP
ncbi:hypothetical protein G5714_024569 [Onychostoma macrolepis]|uniref:Uncharacterized protein n=1 Tax=Onychostoma macrolepis TaxID=369639 RepID=A0A7J6BHR2_9TELE|nr:hypothetical protein G5714_024569 [Onychostoma macrolepis]